MLNSMATRNIWMKTSQDATQKVDVCTDHENMKAIYFLILNEIVEYLRTILKLACVKYLCNNIL